MIQLHRLEGFYWVAHTGGYARAARAFPYPITQPAVHQQVKKLEAELGLALFERVGKEQMRLTAAGRRLFEFVAPFISGLPAVLRAVQSGELGGRLGVAAAPLFVRQLLPAWLQRLQKRAPGIELELREVASPDLGLLREGEVDVLVDHVPEVPDDLASLRVGTLRGYLVLPPGHRLAKRKRLALGELSGETFVAYQRDQHPRDLQMRALARHGIAPGRILSASSAESILGFVESGLGFSLVPALEPGGPRSSGLVARPLEGPDVEFEVLAVWRKSTPEHPALDAFLETAPPVE